ncbi:MAG: electron transfer flavoprotein subunit beta/FixA family protein, partial [Rhizomicrobium sp.]
MVAMKILVPVKRVVDANVRVLIDAAGTGIQVGGLKMSLNPYDETAVEEAVRFKERGWAEEVVAVTIGTTASQDVLRTALALGCDRAILIETETAPESLAVAAALAALVRHEMFDLILA